MQLVLVDTETSFVKTEDSDGDMVFYIEKMEVNCPSPLGGNDAAGNIIHEMTGGGNVSHLNIELIPLGNKEHKMEVWSSEAKSLDFLRNLRNRFKDLVMISVEINSQLESEDNGSSCCLFARAMTIGKSGVCIAHSDFIEKFDLDLLLKASSFHVKVTARIYADAYLLKTTAKKILDENLASDVIIEAGNGVVIRSHKCFLISTSSVFKRMFATEMKESKSGQVDMTDVSEEGVRAFLRFIYHEDLIGPEENIEVAYEVLYAAHKYDVTNLEVMMNLYLLERKDEDYSAKLAFKIYSFVRGIESASKLKTKMLRVMNRKIDELKELPEFKEVFHKNPNDAIDICVNLVKVNPRLKRKADSGPANAGKKVGQEEGVSESYFGSGC